MSGDRRGRKKNGATFHTAGGPGAAAGQAADSVLVACIKTVLATLFFGLRTAYFAFLRLSGREVPWTFVPFMYHSVKAGETGMFSRQMDLLKRYAAVVGAEFSGIEALPARHYVALTFDDGFEDFEHNVVPVLREKRLPATVFVVTRHIGRSPEWIADHGQRLAHGRTLNAEELGAMLAEGVANIGSHSVSHAALSSSLLNADEIRAELEDSKRHLEEAFGQPIRMFALPYGVYDEQVLLCAQEAGYDRVFLSIPLGSFSNIDGHVAGRLEVSPTDSPYSYWLKAQGAYQFLPLTIAAKARWLRWVRRILGIRA
jgi:peptidoglycan/xylan/chitin deacetylase (PgdA/CDA1 family)